MLLCIAAYWAVRIAHADHLGVSTSPEVVARAIALAPENARYWLHWADLKEQAGEHPGNAYERAMAANPGDAEVRIRAGLRAEMDGEYGRAEGLLLEAARLSRQYQPRWTLANFYLRRGNGNEFWRWTRSALDWSYGDRTPLFRLAWEMTDDADTILRRAVSQDAGVLGAYLGFLMATGRLDAAQGCAARLSAVAGKANRATLLLFTEQMLNRRRLEPALKVWNGLAARKLLPYAPLDAAAGRVLTNGDFGEAPLGQGFDWRLPAPRGVFPSTSDKPGLLRLAFSGKQPERCEVLAQWVPVAPGRRYGLGFEYRTEEMAGETGLAWKVSDGAGGGELAAGEPQAAAPEWRKGGLRFATPAGTRWIRLALWYGRVPGTTRIEGRFWLRQVALEETR